MARHVHLGDYLYATCIGISHERLQFGRRVILVGEFGKVGIMRAAACHFGKPFECESPTLIVGEVQMEHVETQQIHCVYHRL